MEEESGIPVVLRYRDGRTVRCLLGREFSPRAAVIEVTLVDGSVEKVDVSSLKAVFFVKDPKRRGLDVGQEDTQNSAPKSAIARVEFFDGEIIRGRVQNYSVANMGFFLYPTAVESNNERIFVVATALSTVSLDG